MVAAIVQARMGSTRLPGKVMAEIVGMPMLFHVVYRVRQAQQVFEVLVATTDEVADRPIVDFASSEGIPVFQGSQEDVLDRYYQAAKYIGAEIIIRITADCPLIDPQIIDKVIEHYKNNKFDYMSNFLPPTYPAGMDVEVFHFRTLELAWEGAKDALDREHVTRYIYSRPDKFRVANVRCRHDYTRFRLTVDQMEDLILIREICKELGAENETFRLEDIVKFLEQNPQLMRLNSQLQSWRYASILRNSKEMDKLQKVVQIYS